MFKWLLVLLVLLMSFTIVNAQQPFNQVSASADARADGKFYLTLTGNGDEIARICGANRECEQQGFGSRIDALNYFGTLIGQAHGFYVQPIPQAPSSASAAVQVAVSTAVPETMPCHPNIQCPHPTQPPLPPYPCSLKPCIYPPAPGRRPPR